eukprot:8929800-Ditylum_brightwellii.AAC.1
MANAPHLLLQVDLACFDDGLSCHGRWLVLKALKDLSKGEGAVDLFCIGTGCQLGGGVGQGGIITGWTGCQSFGFWWQRWSNCSGIVIYRGNSGDFQFFVMGA